MRHQSFPNREIMNAEFHHVCGQTLELPARLRAANTSFMLFTFLVAMGLILWFGGWRVVNGHMTPGELAQFIFYMQVLAMPIRMTGWLVNSYARAVAAGERLFEILDTRSPVQELPTAREMPRVRG